MIEHNHFTRRAFSALCLIGLSPFAQCTQTSAPDPLFSNTRPRQWASLINQNMNLFQIEDDLYRSEQPKPQDVEKIRALGIKTVINFRGLHSDKNIIKDENIQLVRVPIHTWKIGDKHVIRALNAIMKARSRGPILIHCLHGADRTGLISAMYRIIYQNWSKKAALDELINGGYGFHAIWSNIPAYIKKSNSHAIIEHLHVKPQHA